MSERPILFSDPMVQRILDGTKTQTRRVVKHVKLFSPEYDRDWHPHVTPPGGSMPNDWCWWEGPSHGPSLYHHAPCPYGKVGDRLWVREAWRVVAGEPGWDEGIGEGGGENFAEGWAEVAYRADGATKVFHEMLEEEDEQAARATGQKWKPSIHMPRWASRLTLEITDIRVERLNDISEADCCAEGMGSPITRDVKKFKFQQLWDQINGSRPGCNWDLNPWVWALTFKKVP